LKFTDLLRTIDAEEQNRIAEKRQAIIDAWKLYPGHIQTETRQNVPHRHTQLMYRLSTMATQGATVLVVAGG
jgi:dihydroorotase